jgi:crossover junction endodeoxyribonuclease RuvC
MNFVGLDLSLSSSGLVVLTEDCNILSQKLISSPTKESIEYRISYIASQIFSEIKQYEPHIICIEGLSFGSHGQSVLDLAGLNLFVRTCLYNESKKFYVISPTTLKKYVTGTGKAKKELMLLKVYKKFGVEFESSDLCDAYTLSRYGLDNYGI